MSLRVGSRKTCDSLLRIRSRASAYCALNVSLGASDELSRLALFVDDLCEMVVPEEQVRDLADDADNRILECALAGQAELNRARS